jgi:hypothetical protein
MSNLTLTTIDNVTRKTKHNLSAKSVYDQLSQKAADRGMTVKQLAAELRILVTEYSNETMLLDKQLATGYYTKDEVKRSLNLNCVGKAETIYKLAAERESKVQRWEFCKLENERLTFICSLYSQHTILLRTQRESVSAAAAAPVKKTVKPLKKVDTIEVVVREIPDDWESN